jgi:hypothetical protein
MDPARTVPRFADAARTLRRALEEIVDPYRPELHYMRGPGPKWHAAHTHLPVSAAQDIAAMTKARA